MQRSGSVSEGDRAMMSWKAAGATVPIIMLGACGPSTDNVTNDNADLGATSPEATISAGPESTANEAANEVSSGMPVPGSNTPEHIVVNNDEETNRT
jgi:hypothetical protein